MATQSTYRENMAAAVLGALASMIPATLISRTIETAAGVGFGAPVAQGAQDMGAIAFAGSGFIGITVLDRSTSPDDPDKFAEGDSARIMTKGAVWVQASKAVNAGDPVYLTDAGAFTDVATDNTLIPGARFDTSTTAAGLAVVRIG